MTTKVNTSDAKNKSNNNKLSLEQRLENMEKMCAAIIEILEQYIQRNEGTK